MIAGVLHPPAWMGGCRPALQAPPGARPGPVLRRRYTVPQGWWPLAWIGLVADTHLLPRGGAIVLPAALRAGLAGVDAILHAGDIACAEVLAALAEIAPTHAVRGNVDPPGLGLPARLLLEFAGVTVGLTHGHLGSGTTTPRRALRAFGDLPAVIVFGHSHEPLIAGEGGCLLVNPGSPTQPRGRRPSFALLSLAPGGQPQARLVEF